jgi:hypothetical protein
MPKGKKPKSQKMSDLKPRKTISAKEAASVRGGRKAGKGQQEFMIVKMNDVIITG